MVIMKKFLSRVFSEKVLNIAIVILFGLVFLSIPLFSYRAKLYLITWGLTLILIGCASIVLLFHKSIRITSVTIFFFAFCITALFASLLTGLKSFSITPILNTIIIVFFYTYFISQEKTQRKKCVSALFLATIIFAGVYIFTYRGQLFSFGKSMSRLGSKFGDENDIAIFFTIGFVLSFYYFLNIKKWYIKVLNFCLAGIFGFLSFAGGSKISIIIILIMSIIIIGMHFGSKKWFITVGFAAGLIILLIIVMNIPAFETLKDRFLNMIYTFFGQRYKGLNPDYSSIGRLDMLLNGFSLFLRRPLFGFGLNGYATYSTHHSGWSHNHWSDTLCDYGVIGTMLYHIPFFAFLKKSKDKNSTSYMSLLLFLLSTISIALFTEKMFTYFAGLILADGHSTTRLEFSCFNKKTMQKQSKIENKEKINVAEIIPSLDPVGGAETMFVNLCESIKNNHDDSTNLLVIILYNHNPNFLTKKLADKKIKYVFLNKHKGVDFGCAERLASILKDNKIDVIHSHLDTSLTIQLSRFCGFKCPIIHTFHHMVGKDGYKKESLNRFLIQLKKIYPVAVSKNSAQSVSSLTGYTCDCIENGININNFDLSKAMNNRKNDFLCVGSFKRVKNQKYLIDVFKDTFAISERPNLVFLGEGNLKEECELTAGTYKEKMIFFKGAVENVNEYMANSKVLVLPSLSEGNPMVINEALASGMYVIANDVGGISDLITDGENGDLIKANDSEVLGKRLFDRINDIEFLENRRIENTKRLDDISIEKTSMLYVELFRKVYSEPIGKILLKQQQ